MRLKTTWTILLLSYSYLLVFTLEVFSQNVTISGEIKNPLDSSMSFILLRHGLVGEREIIEAKLDKANKFTLKLVLDDLAYIHFYHSNESSVVLRNWLIEKGDSVTMYFDATKILETMSFKGVNAAKYNYYVEDARNWGSWGEKFMQNFGKPIEFQFKYIDSVEAGRINLLAKFEKITSPLFAKVRYADIKGEVNSYRFTPLLPENKPPIPFYDLPNELKKFTRTMPLQSDTTAKSLYYVGYLDALSSFLYNDMKVMFKSSTMSLMDFQRSLYHPKVAENQFAYQIFDKLRTEGWNPTNQKLYDQYVEDYPNSPYIPFLKGRQIKAKVVAEGQKAFDLGVEALAKLESYKGKVIVLDFWASWCSSCIAEAKNVKKIKESLSAPDKVVFLSISLDDKESDWKKAIAKWGIVGHHIRLKNGFKDTVAKQYGVMGLPSYFIIDKEGKFADTNPPRPKYNEGKDFLKTIERVLLEPTR
ncbi:TlpA disulfide reductase family protein [Runella sp. SP2]|uniref:TlpA family protein disulfide reductase n=1 Tax=Runella sp. SP2 TaxID=2268026 RepID=UPI000F081628|nr:TlpA disulfide reductase family protein [Runella sp. SP2]AYQ34079.1 TlpA family protein disulfide reductase [Runella sp. SP2]